MSVFSVLNSILILSILTAIRKSAAVTKGCDYYQALKPGSIYSIASPRYSQNYMRGADCRWAASAPPGYRIELKCNDFRLPNSNLCRGDRVLVSATGRADLRDGKRHCGSSKLSTTSVSTRMTVGLKAGAFSLGGKFKCLMKAIDNSCTCGQLNRGKIVGGTETQINEYPSMAGIIDAKERRIFCGATISNSQFYISEGALPIILLQVSSTHALSAAHCFLDRKISNLGLLIGEHDTSKGKDSPFTVLLKISALIIHQNFSLRTNANDIALIKTKDAIKFTRGVQPACLPFKFRGQSLVNSQVQGTGWGTTSFAGSSSNVLRQVSLRVISSVNCTSTQICTFAKNKDTCQGDSGGPLYHIENSQLFHVGIVSYGIGCATDQPAVNTRVSAYLDWIQQNTRSTIYCIR